MMKVENPTSKAKAVRVAGGLEVIKPGMSASFDVDWSEAEIGRYEAAGLVISKAKKTAAKAPEKPKAE